MNLLTKELVNTFSWSKYGVKTAQRVVINGRKYLKEGVETGAAFVGNVWKVYDPSVKRFKYMLNVGVAKQHPTDINVKKEEGYELANERAFVEPQMTLTFDNNIGELDFVRLCKMYYQSMKTQMVNTKEENLLKEKHISVNNKASYDNYNNVSMYNKYIC